MQENRSFSVGSACGALSNRISAYGTIATPQRSYSLDHFVSQSFFAALLTKTRGLGPRRPCGPPPRWPAHVASLCGVVYRKKRHTAWECEERRRFGAQGPGTHAATSRGKGVCKRPAWNRAKAATKIQLACILTAVKLNARWQLLQHKTLT